MRTPIRSAIVFAVAAVCFPALAAACPVCYGNNATPLTNGASNGVLFLLGIVGLVQVGFIALFIAFWRRSRAIAKRKESMRLIQGGAH